MRQPANYDQQTLRILRQALEDAARALPIERQSQKAVLASRILEIAAGGERDPIRLSAFALLELPPDNPEHAETESVAPAEPCECKCCGSAMRLVFRGPNPFGPFDSEIREHRCPGCGSRHTSRWPQRA
jgi:hypothetical protein